MTPIKIATEQEVNEVLIQGCHNLWQQIQLLNLEFGLKQSTIDDCEQAIQKRINELSA